MEKIEGFLIFTKESMLRCREDSEKSVTNIMEIVNNLADSIAKVSNVSDEALQILNNIKTKLSESDGQKKISELNHALSEFRSQHSSVESSINSIIQSLQFQDRVTQNLDNMSSMISLWWELRSSETDPLEFGKKLLEKTTMEDERKIIRSFIPGLPEEKEEKKEGDLLLF